ncbi:MAG: hypothetical protein KKD74_10225 [Bacteroidetes bacterium]|nr:hypothetical protein [Bacteroidota bacterium]
MEIEIFTLCDFAQEYQRKMVIVGTFDTINAKEFPCVHPNCSIATRIRFDEKEFGEHKFKITLINDKNENVISPLEGEMQIKKTNSGTFSAVNMVISLNQLKFDKPGRYSIELYIDETWKTGLPLILQKQ